MASYFAAAVYKPHFGVDPQENERFGELNLK